MAWAPAKRKGRAAGAVGGSRPGRAGDALGPHVVPVPRRPSGPAIIPPAGRSHAKARLLGGRPDHHDRAALQGGRSAAGTDVGHAHAARSSPGAAYGTAGSRTAARSIVP